MTSVPSRAITRVSVVLETDSVHPYDDLTITDCLDALARQRYPRELIELIVVDGGKVPELADVVRRWFPGAVILECPNGTKFEQKNLGMRAASGDIVALVDGDCVAPPDWVSTVVGALDGAPPDVAGIQGVTELSPGRLSPEVSALLYGIRAIGDEGFAGRLVTDNVAFRREAMRGFAFEHASFGTVVDSLLLHRLARSGRRLLLCERLRMRHSFPRSAPTALGWFLLRAWAVGYFMVTTRRLEPDLPGSALLGPLGVGWPLLALGKARRDLAQFWEHRRRVNARLARAAPLFLVFELTLFLGGLGALARLPAPRVA